jgi:hypothetical protein
MNCPHCGSARINRSHRVGAFERVVLSPLLIRPYRCGECRFRFLRPRRHAGTHVKSTMKNPPVLLRLVIWTIVIAIASVVVAGAVVWYTGRDAPSWFDMSVANLHRQLR